MDSPHLGSTSRRGNNAAGTRATTAATPLLLTVPQAARLLAMGTTTAWQLVWSQELPSLRRGRRWVCVPYQSCIDWVERNRNDRRRTDKQEKERTLSFVLVLPLCHSSSLAAVAARRNRTVEVRQRKASAQTMVCKWGWPGGLCEPSSFCVGCARDPCWQEAAPRVLLRKSVRPLVLAILRAMPSPEKCGCASRKAWMIKQIEAI